MLLRNFYSWNKYFLYTNGGGSSGNKIPCISTNGDSVTGSMYMASCEASNKQPATGNTYILQLGTGDTPPTKADYKLENPIENDLFSNQTATGKVYTNATEDHIVIVTHGVCNASEEPITVKEIGILLTNCLITRTVLDKPVTIQPGEYASFTETIEIP